MRQSESKEARTRRELGISGETVVPLGSTQMRSDFRDDGAHAWIIRSPEDVTRRLDRLIDDIQSRFHRPNMGKPKADVVPNDVLVVAHGHILRALAMRWIKRGLTEGVSLLLEGKATP